MTQTGALTWGNLMAAIALVVSIITLYLAHLRGPSIKLARPGGLFDLKGIEWLDGHSTVGLDVRLLVANVGNRPGVLFWVKVAVHDQAIREHPTTPRSEDELPRLLLAGEGWTTDVRLVVHPRDGSWNAFFQEHDTLDFDVIFLASASLVGVKQPSEKVRVRLDALKKEVGC
jgi:hypothetical protein